MAREDATRARIEQFLHALGRHFSGRSATFLAGGSMLVYEGFRHRTIDVDYRVDLTAGDATKFLQALRAAQRGVNLNIEPFLTALSRIRRGQERDTYYVLALCRASRS